MIERYPFGRGGIQALRHLRHATGLHAGCVRDQGISFDQAGFDRAHAGAARTRPRLLERRSQADCQPRLPEASEIRLRRLPPDALQRLRSPRHHPQRPRRAGTQARRGRRGHPRPHAVLRRIRRTGRRPRMALQRRSQHRRRRSEGMLLPGPGRAGAPGRPPSNRSALATKSMPW